MTRARVLPFLVPFLLAAVPALAQQERLTWEDVGKPIAWVSDAPAVRWASDGIHVEVQEGKKVVWLDPRTGKTREPDKDASPAAQPRGERGERRGGRLRGGADDGSAAGRPRLQARDGGVWAGEQRLSDAHRRGNKLEQMRWSPDGARASFVRDGNLVIAAAAGGGEWQVTEDGGPDRFYGVLDWVYQEEVYGRGNYQGHWWNPGSDKVAFLALDQTAVKRFTVVNHVPEGFLDKERNVAAEVTPYPKAGDPNPTARFAVAHVSDKAVQWVDLAGYPADVLVVRATWTPDGDTLLLTLQDRIQTWAELAAVDPRTGKVSKWIREESSSWVNRPDAPRWLEDGTFLWSSERTGYNHVYRYRPGGELVTAVTSGEWQVRTIEHVDEAAGLLWFEGTEGGAIGRNHYRVGLDGKGLVRLTQGAGSHSLDWNGDRTFFLDRVSAMDQPPAVRLCQGSDGAVVKELGQAGRGAAERYAFADKRRATIPARDGYPLDASVMLPTEFEAGRRYPVFVPTYSGPDAPSVRDAWSHSTFHQFLCQQGFVVLQVNVRSASGRGQAHTGLCYRQLGVPELADLEDAVDWVCREHQGDPDKVAISGWSYGGFMAAYALTHGSRFQVGIAGAGVYDWRLYDTIYTERYMRTPQENAAGYDATSVIKAAKNLHGHLVILHGTMDDNVHLQNAMQLVWALQTAGKTAFELMVYPRSMHGPNPQVRWHVQHMEWRTLRRMRDGQLGE